MAKPETSLAIDIAAPRCPDRCTWQHLGQHHTVELGAILGSGRFATVRAVGHLEGLPPLAAKIIPGGHASHEVALLATLDHPHIVKCFGLAFVQRYELILLEARGHGGIVHLLPFHLETLTSRVTDVSAVVTAFVNGSPDLFSLVEELKLKCMSELGEFL